MILGVAFRVLGLLFLAAPGVFTPLLDSGSREARQGAKAYERGDWAAAQEHFGKAMQDRPASVLDYNLGAASYRMQDFVNAARAFEAAKRSGEIDPSRAAYNVGTAKHRVGDLQGALESFREALRNDPADEDARYNYELTLQQLQAGEQDPNQSEPSEEGENQEGENESSDSPPDSSGSSPEGGQQDQESQEGQENNQPEEGDSEEGQEQPAPSDTTGDEASEDSLSVPPLDPSQLLTPEEAARLLNAITPDERELLQARLKATQRRKVEKDW